MGIHIYLLLLFQTLWCSVIGAYDPNVKVSMTHTILKDHLALHKNNVIQTIWQQEPATTCDMEKPSEKMLTNKRLLQFNFVPYLCVILYDSTLRYIELNASHGNAEINHDIPQKIVSEFLPDSFCQKMKENNWYTSIGENKLWVSNFNNDMKNINLCQRYCVGDGVNPICAYALWLDISVKNVERELSHPNSNESHPSRAVLIPPKEVNASIGKKTPVVHAPTDNAHVSTAESTRPNVNPGDSKLSPSVSAVGQTAVTPKQNNNNLLAHHYSGIEGIPVTTGQRPPFPNSAPFPVLINTADQGGEHVLTGSAPENSGRLNLNINPSLNASLPVPANNLNPGKTSGPPGPPTPNNVQDAYRPQQPRQFPKPDGPILVEQPNIKGSSSREDKMGTTQKETSVEKSVSKAAQLELTKTSGTTLSVSPQQAAETPPGIPIVEAGVENNPAGNPGEYQTEGLGGVSGDHKASVDLGRGYAPANGQDDTSNIVSPANPPIPSAPETPDIPEHTEDETHKVRGNTTVPENVTKEAPGSPKGEPTETKPNLDQGGKSDPEAANQAFEGEDGRASNGEADDHEEQNALDDGVAEVENGEALGVHGSDREEAGIDTIDQEFPTEGQRYNEGDNEELPRPDDSTKLSNNNNNKEYLAGSDEDEADWPPGEQARMPQNDADAGYAHDRFVDAEDSHFFAYFMTMIVLCIIGYLIFHNKQKILALALEGRARKGTRRRPSTSGYRKLDSNLEEAVTSNCSASVTHVIY